MKLLHYILDENLDRRKKAARASDANWRMMTKHRPRLAVSDTTC